jgi:hypothetical protein
MSNEPDFSLPKFFEFGVFKPDDVQLLTSIGEGSSEPVPQLSQAACTNLVTLPTSETEIHAESWISEETMDYVLRFFANKYPHVFFIESMDWSNKWEIANKRLQRKKEDLTSKRYLASCICIDGHWHWIAVDFGCTPACLYYGDNYNSKSEELNSLLCGMLWRIAKITANVKSSFVECRAVPCPEFLGDVNNCGIYSICYLMAMMESNFDTNALQSFFSKNLITKEKMPFVRYRLAMCLALQQLNVPIDYTQIEIPDFESMPLDLSSLVPMFQFYDAIEIKTEPINPNEWQMPIVFSDLNVPHPCAEPYIYILYFIGSSSGIDQTELIRRCEEKSIAEEVIYQYVNITCRHGEKSRKLPKSQRVVREYCGSYYLTAAALPLFQSWNWGFSRYDKITLKKKVTRRTPRAKPLLLLENGPKKPRTYTKSGHTIRWKQIIRDLIGPYKIPMTTAMIKRLYVRTYSNTNVLNLSQQGFTVRIHQAIETLLTDDKDTRSSKTAKESSHLIHLPAQLIDIVPLRNLNYIVIKMSADVRTAAAEYVRYSERDTFESCDGLVLLKDRIDLNESMARIQKYHDINVEKGAMHTEWLENAFVESKTYRWRFVEFIIRLAIAKNIEAVNHFRSLVFLKETVDINFVTAKYLSANWERDANHRRNKTNACTKFLTSLEHILFVNQCEKNATPLFAWAIIDQNDDVQRRLVCKVADQPTVLNIDAEGYVCAAKVIHYGTLFKIPAKRQRYEGWFVRTNNHRSTNPEEMHGFLVEYNGVSYLECRYNLLPGERFYHVL